MRIEKFRKKYQKETEKLVKDSLFEIFGRHKLQTFEDFSSYNKKNGLFLISIDKNKIIGSIAIKKDGTIKRMYLKKEYRNKGLAQELYNNIEKFAKRKGLGKLKLSTTPKMKSAISFYKKNGFKKMGENKRTNQIFFEKKLK